MARSTDIRPVYGSPHRLCVETRVSLKFGRDGGSEHALRYPEFGWAVVFCSWCQMGTAESQCI